MPVDRHAARRWIDAQEVTDRKNARVMDRLTVALPVELDRRQRRALVHDFGEKLTLRQASWFAAIHQDSADAHNPHVHLVIRDRDIATGKRVAMLSEKGACDRVRRLWEETANAALAEAAQASRIDRRSHAAKGIKKQPQRHRGPFQWRNSLAGQFADAARQPPQLAAVADERHQLVPFVPADDDVVLRQELRLGDFFQLRPEFAQPSGQAGALEQRFHAEADGGHVCLVRHRLAGEAVKPPLDATSQGEIVGMDGENLSLPQHRLVQPRRQFDLPWARWVRFAVRLLRGHGRQRVFLGNGVVGQPRKRPFFPGSVVKADVGDDRGHAQPPDGLGQFPIVPSTCPAPHLAQGVVWREANFWGCCGVVFNGVVQMRGGEDDQIPVPDCGDAEFSRGMNLNRNFGAFESDRLNALFLQGQERELHDIAIVTERRLKGADGQHVELNDFSHAPTLARGA